jgi:macrolide-specific efflux system membrane fusion protein
LILRIARLSPMTVWAEVSEADIGHVRPGMDAWFTTLSGGARRWKSTVRQILPLPPKPLDQANQGGGSPSSAGKNGGGRVVLYTVLLDVDNADQALMAEMTAQIFFVAGSARDALTAPVSALRSGPQPDLQLAQVMTRDGEIEQRTVRTGVSDRLKVQVLEGLTEGERLLIKPAVGSGG